VWTTLPSEKGGPTALSWWTWNAIDLLTSLKAPRPSPSSTGSNPDPRSVSWRGTGPGRTLWLATSAPPQALQAADRFHLVRNVSDALKYLIRSRRWDYRAPVAPGEKACSTPANPPLQERQTTPLKQARWEAVREQRLKGLPIRGIARVLGISRRTVRNYLASDRPPAYSQRRPQPTKLTPYLEYLRVECQAVSTWSREKMWSSPVPSAPARVIWPSPWAWRQRGGGTDTVWRGIYGVSALIRDRHHP